MLCTRFFARWFISVFLFYLFFSYYLDFGVSQSAVVRYFLVVSFALVLMLIRYDNRIRKKCLLFCQERSIIFLSVLFLYLMLHCLVALDWQSLRRLVFIFLFALVVLFYYVIEGEDSVSLTNGFFKVIPVFSLIVASVYLFLYFQLNGFVLPSKGRALTGGGALLLIDYKNSVLFGMHLAFLFAFCLYEYFKSKRCILIGFTYTAVFLVAGAVFITMARTAWIVCFLVAAVFLLCRVREHFVRCAVLVVPFVLLGGAYLSSQLSFHLNRGLTRRDEIWLEVWRVMEEAKEFIFGTGIGAPMDFVVLSKSAAVQPHFHNVYLEVFYKTGVVGLTLFVGLIIFVLYRLYFNRKQDEAVLCGALLFSIFIGMFFDYSNVYYSPNLMWLVFWFPLFFSLSVGINFSSSMSKRFSLE